MITSVLCLVCTAKCAMTSVHFSLAGMPVVLSWSCTLWALTEAAAARAQQKADSSRHVQQHKVGSTKPDVTRHAGMHGYAKWLRLQ